MSERSRRAVFALAVAASISVGCSSVDSTCEDNCPPPPNVVHMDFTRAGGFYAAPFPSDDRKNGDAIDLSDFPNPGNAILVKQSLQIIALDVHGFSASSSIYFELDDDLGNVTLPDYHSSVAASSPVFLIGVDEAAPDFGKRYPIDVAFQKDGGPFGTMNELALLPLQGVPLRPKTRYAAVVLKSLKSAAGSPVAASASMNTLLSGSAPDGIGGRRARRVRRGALVARPARRRHRPNRRLHGVHDRRTRRGRAARSATRWSRRRCPSIDKPFAPNEVFDDFCVYSDHHPDARVPGRAASLHRAGGDVGLRRRGRPGAPARWRTRTSSSPSRGSRCPRRATRSSCFSRTGAGGDRPLVDRGVQATTGGPPITPGTGPALYFAIGGLRRLEHRRPARRPAQPDQRQRGLPHLQRGQPGARCATTSASPRRSSPSRPTSSSTRTVDVSGCPGAVAPGGMARFDVGTMALMGHSMGATISPLALADRAALPGRAPERRRRELDRERHLQAEPVARAQGHRPGPPRRRAGRATSSRSTTPCSRSSSGRPSRADPPVYARRITLEPAGGAAAPRAHDAGDRRPLHHAAHRRRARASRSASTSPARSSTTRPRRSPASRRVGPLLPLVGAARDRPPRGGAT